LHVIAEIGRTQPRAAALHEFLGMHRQECLHPTKPKPGLGGAPTCATKPAETYANLGGFGMGSYKPFGILVEGWGEG